MKKQFNHKFKEFLIDRSDEMDYSRSDNYRKFDERTKELYGVIKAALPEDLGWELSGLDDSYGDRQAAAANLSYQEGFMQGARFLLNILANSADLSPELPEVTVKRDDNLNNHEMRGIHIRGINPVKLSSFVPFMCFVVSMNCCDGFFG